MVIAYWVTYVALLVRCFFTLRQAAMTWKLKENRWRHWTRRTPHSSVGYVFIILPLLMDGGRYHQP